LAWGDEGERITEGESSMDSGKEKEIVEDSNPEEEHSLSNNLVSNGTPSQGTPHFEGTKRETLRMMG